MVPTNFADRLIDGDPSALLVQDIFGPNIALASVRCRECRSVKGVGSLCLTAAPSAVILRCPDCDHVVMTLAHH